MCRLPLLCSLLWACSLPEAPPPEDLLPPERPADLAQGPDLPRGEVPRERGSLIDLVEREPTSTAAGAYKPPAAAEAARFRDAVALLLRGQGEQAVPLLTQVGYTVTDFTDDSFEPARPRRFYVLRERVVGRRYLGLYILSLTPSANRGHLYLEAPFGIDDFIEHVHRQGVRTLLGADLGGLLLNTADRCSVAETASGCIQCTGTCLRCRGVDRGYFPISDLGHAEATFFQAAHEAVSADPRVVVLSLHGHATTALGYVVSDGTRLQAGPAAAVHRLGRAYAAAAGVAVRSCNDGTSTQLCGETLLQGRHLNGYTPLCTGTTPGGERRFLVLHQLYEVRRADGMAAPGTLTLLGAALKAVWPD